MRKSFMFYLTWKSQLDVLTDKELRRLVYNLISWHQGEEIELKTKSDQLVWNGILPALEVNDIKWKNQSERSRENGKLGGRPSKSITQETQEVYEKPVNSKMSIVNSEKDIVDSELKNVESEKDIVDSKMENQNLNLKSNNTGISQSEFFRKKIENLENILVVNFPQYPFLLTMANPGGIKELKNHIDNKKELVEITSILKDLASSKKTLRGRYD